MSPGAVLDLFDIDSDCPYGYDLSKRQANVPRFARIKDQREFVLTVAMMMVKSSQPTWCTTSVRANILRLVVMKAALALTRDTASKAGPWFRSPPGGGGPVASMVSCEDKAEMFLK